MKKRRANLGSSRVWKRSFSTWWGRSALDMNVLLRACFQLCLPRRMPIKIVMNFSSLSTEEIDVVGGGGRVAAEAVVRVGRWWRCRGSFFI